MGAPASVVSAADAQERETRIERRLAGNRKFIAEPDRLAAVVVPAMTAGAALFGAAFIKLVGWLDRLRTDRELAAATRFH